MRCANLSGARILRGPRDVERQMLRAKIGFEYLRSSDWYPRPRRSLAFAAPRLCDTFSRYRQHPAAAIEVIAPVRPGAAVLDGKHPRRQEAAVRVAQHLVADEVAGGVVDLRRLPPRQT